jgi:hypothetical protein
VIGLKNISLEQLKLRLEAEKERTANLQRDLADLERYYESLRSSQLAEVLNLK